MTKYSYVPVVDAAQFEGDGTSLIAFLNEMHISFSSLQDNRGSIAVLIVATPDGSGLNIYPSDWVIWDARTNNLARMEDQGFHAAYKGKP